MKWIAALLLALAPAAWASPLLLPDTVDGMPKSGELRYRYLVFKVFDAAFYTPSGTEPATVLDPSTPRALLIRYHRDVSASQFIDLAKGSLEKQLSPERLDEIAPTLDSLNASYRDVGAGDTYLLKWTPESGMEVTLNGETLSAFECSDFARDYFSIWFGQKPLSRKMKTRLLGAD